MPVPKKNHNAITGRVKKFPPEFLSAGLWANIKACISETKQSVTHLEDLGAVSS